MTCPLCNRSTDTEIVGICTACEARLSQQLGEIAAYASACSQRIEPERSGEQNHAPAYGSRPPVNITTLDYADRLGFTSTFRFSDGTVRASDHNGLAMLHEWERLIREERQLTPPALVPYAGSQLKEITNVCAFLTTHLQWAAQQPWADELAKEVSDIHRAGMIALRAVPARRSRIACPGDNPETGNICDAWLTLPSDMADYIRQPGETAPKKTLWCTDCGTTWTIERLFKVAVALHGVAKLVSVFGKKDVAHMLGVSVRRVEQRLVKESA